MAEIHVANGWNWRTTSDDKQADDLALLRLDRPLNITPVPVATAPPHVNEQVISNGWSTRPDRCGNITSRMRQWPLQVDTCREATDSDICASTPEHEVAPCEGGSGAPMFTIADNEVGSVAGVYSLAFGDDCHGPTHVLFTSLARYRDFITTTTSGTE